MAQTRSNTTPPANPAPPSAPSPEPSALDALRDRVSSAASNVAGRFDLSDRRTLIGLGVILFCGGIMTGARLMRGAIPPGEVRTVTKTERVEVPVPGPVQYLPGEDCPECAEKKIRAERERAAVANGQAMPPDEPAQPRVFSPYSGGAMTDTGTAPQESVLGDSSVPGE